MSLIHTTAENVQILAYPGSKSPCDFIVKYRELGKRERTPKHIHMVVDLFMKRAADPMLTRKLLDHIVDNICLQVQPSPTNHPSLQIYAPQDALEFVSLNGAGEYSIEFLLVTLELIQTQEITNYPGGNGHHGLYTLLRNGGSIFSVVSAATFR